MYGVNGMLVAGGVGLLRVTTTDNSLKAQYVCTDQVVNAIMAILWEIGFKNL